MNVRRLLRLARFLDKLPQHKFLFSDVVDKFDTTNNCGAVCCAIGWTPGVFPTLVRWVGDDMYDHEVSLKQGRRNPDYVYVASKLFDISRDEAAALFTPEAHRDWIEQGEDEYYEDSLLGYNASPREVADSIRAFVAWKKMKV